jgi:hypothetical protein
MLKANLTFGEVLPDDPNYPQDGQCKSGHIAEGEDRRFFVVEGETLDRSRWGVYCVGCVRKAHAMSQQARQRQSIVGALDVNRRRH